MSTTTTISDKGLLLAEERRFWQEMEAISRSNKDKKVHAYSRKMVKWLGRAMLEVARDQMDGDEDDEETSEAKLKKIIEEDKKTPSEKIRDEALLHAFMESQWADSPF